MKVWLVIHADRHVVAVFDSKAHPMWIRQCVSAVEEAFIGDSVWLDAEEWEVQ